MTLCAEHPAPRRASSGRSAPAPPHPHEVRAQSRGPMRMGLPAVEDLAGQPQPLQLFHRGRHAQEPLPRPGGLRPLPCQLQRRLGAWKSRPTPGSHLTRYGLRANRRGRGRLARTVFCPAEGDTADEPPVATRSMCSI